jgi:hypothetical protein
MQLRARLYPVAATRNPKQEIPGSNLKPETRNLKPEIKNLELRTY